MPRIIHQSKHLLFVEAQVWWHGPRNVASIQGIGGRQNASELLKNALGDKRRNNNVNDLVNFDDEKDEYIWYEYEGENLQNQYHAYHLVLHDNHQTSDKVAVGRITSRVMAIIDYRRQK